MNFILEIVFFKTSLLVFFGEMNACIKMLQDQEIEAEEKAEIIQELYGKPCNGMVSDIGKGRVFVFFNFKPKKLNNWQVGIISHESLHVAYRMLNWVGIQTEDNEELLCMTQQLVFESILNEVRPNKSLK